MDLSPELQASLTCHLLEHGSDGVYFVSLERKILLWNKAAERISGYPAAAVSGHCCADNILRHIDRDGTEFCRHGCPLSATLQDGQLRRVELFLHHSDGHRVPVEVTTVPVRDGSGAIIGALELFRDSSDRAALLRTMEELRDEVYRDPLTRIGNRKYGDFILRERFREFLEQGISFGLLMIDIDFFKTINDTWGHALGDRVLQMVAGSLESALRKLDVLWRWGGEEFAAVFPGADHDSLAAIAERLRVFVEKSWLEHQGETIRVKVSIGGTLVGKVDDPESLLQRADRMLYQSKKTGRNKVTIG